MSQYYSKAKINTNVLIIALFVVVILLISFKLMFTRQSESVFHKEKIAVSKPSSSINSKSNFNITFSNAIKLKKNADYKNAIEKFKEAIEQDPNSPLADNAYYEIVEILNSNEARDYLNAIDVCKVILKNYPESEVTDNAQYTIAQTLHIKLNNPVDALLEYKKFLKLYPQSRLAPYVQSIVENLESDPDNDGVNVAQAIDREMPNEMFEDGTINREIPEEVPEEEPIE